VVFASVLLLCILQSLMEKVHRILTSSESGVSLKNITLRFLLTIVTLTENVSQNTILEYLMIHHIFEALLAVSNISLV